MTYTYTYDDLHRLTSAVVTNPNPPITYAYDANGNLTSSADFSTFPNPAVTRTLTWNADNMPLSVTRAGVTASFLYDGLGRRAKKQVSGGGAATYYVSDQYEVIGGAATKYVFAGNLRVAKVVSGVTHYFHKDHLGSSTVMSDYSGTVVEASEYYPFGAFRSHLGTATSSYKFTDQELDAESGLYNYDARLYDPVIGRFISADSIVQGGGYDPQLLNRYSYVRNNPILYVDPTGHRLGDGYSHDEHDFDDNPGNRSKAEDQAREHESSYTEIRVIDGQKVPIDIIDDRYIEGIGWTRVEVVDYGAFALGFRKDINGNTIDIEFAESKTKSMAMQEMASQIAGFFGIERDKKKGTKDDEIASERMAIDMGKQIEKDFDEAARREFHDLNKYGRNRTVGELKEHVREIYEGTGKNPPGWMR